MSKVVITRSKLDGLASTISAKSGAALPLTLDEMDAAVESIDLTTGSVYQDQDGYLVVDDSESTAPQGNISITANGTYDVADYAGVVVDVSGSGGLSLEYETGTITSTSSSGGLTIPFSSPHDNPPCFFTIVYDGDGKTYSQYSGNGVLAMTGANFVEALSASTIESKSSSPYHMNGQVMRTVKGSSTYSSAALTITTDGGTTWSYYATSAELIMPSSTSLCVGDYKWLAIWKTW